MDDLHLRESETFSHSLGNFSVDMVEARMSKKMRGPVYYIMRVTSRTTHHSWEISHSFDDFFSFKNSILSTLECGHLCTGCCPFLWLYIKEYFPRRHLFRSNTKSVIVSRLNQLQGFMDNLLQAVEDAQNSNCVIATRALPVHIAAFLCENNQTRNASFCSSSDSNSDYSPTVRQEKVMTTSHHCSLCLVRRQPSDSPSSSEFSMEVSREFTIGVSSKVSSEVSSEVSCEFSSFTKLKCGHNFHDECIIEHLNHNLTCPLCFNQVL